MNVTQSLSFFVILLLMSKYLCLQAIPERAELTYRNDSFLAEGVILNVRRYSRKGDYVINLVFTLKTTLDNSVSVDVIFYQYLHNEFRRSFVEMHFKLCDLTNNDPLIGETLRHGGLVCPLPPGKHSLSNMTFNQDFNFVWPFEKGQVEFIFRINKACIGKGIIVMTFKQNLLKTKP